jgi:hypothetical protein
VLSDPEFFFRYWFSSSVNEPMSCFSRPTKGMAVKIIGVTGKGFLCAVRGSVSGLRSNGERVEG